MDDAPISPTSPAEKPATSARLHPVRLLGVDFGSRRIGVAVSEPASGLCLPFETIHIRGALEPAYVRLAEIVQQEKIDRVVVGLPLNMDGTEGPQAAETRTFGAALATRIGRPCVEYFDERLTTFSAESGLREAGMSRGGIKARQDAVAAQMILQGYIDAQRKNDEPGANPTPAGLAPGIRQAESLPPAAQHFSNRRGDPPAGSE